MARQKGCAAFRKQGKKPVGSRYIGEPDDTETPMPMARMMAVADIFEALTASDRPYKSGKTVSQSLAIMVKMVRPFCCATTRRVAKLRPSRTRSTR